MYNSHNNRLLVPRNLFLFYLKYIYFVKERIKKCNLLLFMCINANTLLHQNISVNSLCRRQSRMLRVLQLIVHCFTFPKLKPSLVIVRSTQPHHDFGTNSQERSGKHQMSRCLNHCLKLTFSSHLF